MKPDVKYVSRAGVKLEAALAAFGIDATGLVCMDFGSHTGGFVDCLLQHGAARVHAVDPGYGILNYSLRRDPRVVVHERTNALEFESPELADLLTIDVGWTPQRLVLPAVRRCLQPNGTVVSLIKPQYEASREQLRGGVVREEHLERVLEGTRGDVRDLGWVIGGEIESPILGQGGNREFLWRLLPQE